MLQHRRYFFEQLERASTRLHSNSPVSAAVLSVALHEDMASRYEYGKLLRPVQVKPPYYPAGNTPDERGRERPRMRGDRQNIRVSATPPTSAPRLGSPRPHPHRDRAHPAIGPTALRCGADVRTGRLDACVLRLLRRPTRI